MLHNSFQNSHVEFNRRHANEITHELTQVALDNASPHIYPDLPSCI